MGNILEPNKTHWNNTTCAEEQVERHCFRNTQWQCVWYFDTRIKFDIATTQYALFRPNKHTPGEVGGGVQLRFEIWMSVHKYK